MKVLANGFRVLLAALFLGETPVGAEEVGRRCTDPIFVQFEARIDERATVEQRLQGWQEFLRTYPSNPCASEVHKWIQRLQESVSHARETSKGLEWKQRSRGGLIEPDQSVFPHRQLLADPAPVNRVCFSSELVWATRRTLDRAGAQAPVWAQLFKLEVAPVYNLGLSVDLPLLAADIEEAGFGYAMGNILFGVRWIWGSYLSGDKLPLVVSAGLWWGIGSSVWSAPNRLRLLDAMAYATPYFYHFFRKNQSDYGLHAEAQLGLGNHFILAAVAYHLLDQGEPVDFSPPVDPADNLIRVDLAWQLKLTDWLGISGELNGGLGLPRSSNTLHLFLSPGVRFHLGHLLGGITLRLPFLDVADLNRAVVSFELGAQLYSALRSDGNTPQR